MGKASFITAVLNFSRTPDMHGILVQNDVCEKTFETHTYGCCCLSLTSQADADVALSVSAEIQTHHQPYQCQ